MQRHTANAPEFAAELRRRIERAEQRLDQSRTDAEFEGNRQVIIWLTAQLDAIGRRAA